MYQWFLQLMGYHTPVVLSCCPPTDLLSFRLTSPHLTLQWKPLLSSAGRLFPHPLQPPSHFLPNLDSISFPLPVSLSSLLPSLLSKACLSPQAISRACSQNLPHPCHHQESPRSLHHVLYMDPDIVIALKLPSSTWYKSSEDSAVVAWCREKRAAYF